MARPRQFPHLADAPPRLSAEAGRSHCPSGLSDLYGPSERENRAFTQQAAALTHPVAAGWYDPVSITVLLELLLRLEHDTTMRAADLTKMLNAEYPNLIWRPVVVGRILSDLCEATANLDTDNPPLDKRLSHGGLRFAVAVSPANWRWLTDARIAMGTLAERTVQIERATGETSRRESFPFDAFDGIEYVRDRAAA